MAFPARAAVGFKYWSDPGPFVEYVGTGNWAKFLGYWSVMTSAVFSFAGVESLAMAAAETRSPRTAIPKAVKRVFVRIVLFYILAVLIVGGACPSNDPDLGDGYTTAQSPFVIAASRAGIAAIPSVVNAIVITSAWSASNQSLLHGHPCAVRHAFQERRRRRCSQNRVLGDTVRVRAVVHVLHVSQLHGAFQRCHDRVLLVGGPDGSRCFGVLVDHPVESSDSGSGQLWKLQDIAETRLRGIIHGRVSVLFTLLVY